MNNLQKAKEALKNPIPTKPKESNNIIEENDYIKLIGKDNSTKCRGIIVQIDQQTLRRNLLHIKRDDRQNGGGIEIDGYGKTWVADTTQKKYSQTTDNTFYQIQLIEKHYNL